MQRLRPRRPILRAMLAAQNPALAGGGPLGTEICWWTGGTAGAGSYCCSYYGDPLPHCSNRAAAPSIVFTKPVAPTQSLASPQGTQEGTVCWTAPNGATCCHTEGQLFFGCAHIVGSGRQASKIPLNLAANYGAPPHVRARMKVA